MTGDQKRRCKEKQSNCYCDGQAIIEDKPQFLWEEESLADMLECSECPWTEHCEVVTEVIKGY